MHNFAGGGITDEQVVSVLRPFVRGTRPMLNALRESDPFGLRRRMLAVTDSPATGSGTATGTATGAQDAPDAPDEDERGLLAGARDRVLDWVSTVQVPGTPAWAAMDARQRTDWWIGRVGRFTALMAAVPGIGGALADRLPVQDALGAAGQGLLLCAIAGEYGIRDEDSQVRLLASVLFDRYVDAALVGAADQGGARGGAQGAPKVAERHEVERHEVERREEERREVERRSTELTAELAESKRTHGRFTLRAIAGTVWRMGRLLWRLGDELGKRPQGRWYHRLLGMLPLVGLLGDYLGERAALRRVARAARRWIAEHQAVAQL